MSDEPEPWPEPWVCEHCGAHNEQMMTANGAVYCDACGEYAVGE